MPEQTLREQKQGKISRQTTTSGPKRLFTFEEEKDLVDHIQMMANVGSGYNRQELRLLLTETASFLRKRRPKPDEKISERHVDRFLKRWPQLKYGKPRDF